jgi:hypothetical protein
LTGVAAGDRQVGRGVRRGPPLAGGHVRGHVLEGGVLDGGRLIDAAVGWPGAALALAGDKRHQGQQQREAATGKIASPARRGAQSYVSYGIRHR